MNNPDDLLLAVDVGNSKIEVVLATRGGDVLANVTGLGASPQTLGPHGTWQLITDLTNATIQRRRRFAEGHRRSGVRGGRPGLRRRGRRVPGERTVRSAEA